MSLSDHLHIDADDQGKPIITPLHYGSAEILAATGVSCEPRAVHPSPDERITQVWSAEAIGYTHRLEVVAFAAQELLADPSDANRAALGAALAVLKGGGNA